MGISSENGSIFDFSVGIKIKMVYTILIGISSKLKYKLSSGVNQNKIQMFRSPIGGVLVLCRYELYQLLRQNV